MTAGMSEYAGVARAPFLLLPPTLVAAGAAASAWDGAFSWSRTLLALVGLIALHMAVNILNEWSDMRTGIDLETERTPFSGGSGTLPAGGMSLKAALIFGLLTADTAFAGDDPATDTANEPAAGVTMKDGSRLVGEVVGMADGNLTIKTASAGDVPVNAAEITEMYSKLEMRLLLKGEEEEIVEGSVESFDGETFNVRVKGSPAVRAVPLSAVAATCVQLPGTISAPWLRMK